MRHASNFLGARAGKEAGNPMGRELELPREEIMVAHTKTVAGMERRESGLLLSAPATDYLLGMEEISVPGTQPQRFRFNWSGVGSRHWALFFPNNIFYVSKYVQPIVISISNRYSNINQIITFLFTFLPCIQTLVLYVTLRVRLYSD